MADLNNIDTSIYAPLLRQNAQQDPLAMLGHVVGIRNQLLQGQQMQAEQKAKMAYGKILQSSIDPETGQLDWKKAYTGLASSPDAAFLANEFLSQAASQQNVEASTVLTHANGVLEKLTAVGRYAAPVAIMGQNATKAAALKAAQLAFADGVMDKQQLMQITAQITSAPGKDVDKPNPAIGQMMTGIVQRAQTASETMSQVLGENHAINTGGQIQHVNINPITKKVTFLGGSAAVMNQTPTAAEKNQLVPVGTTPSGNPIAVPRGAPSMPAMLSGGPSQLPGGGALPTSDVLGNPGQPGAPAAVQTPPPPAPTQGAATAPGSPPAPTSDKLELANSSEYAVKTREAAGEYRANLVKQAGDMDASLMQSGEAIKILSNKNMTPGGLAEKKTDIAKALSGLGVNQKIVDAVSNGSLTDSTLIRKYLGQGIISYLNQNIARGAQTNYSLGVTENINPNMEMTPEALRKLLDFGRRMQKIKAVYEPQAMDAWVAAGRNPAEFGPEWNKVLAKKGYLGELPK